MKAAQFKEVGGPEVVEIVEVDTPQPKRGQVLVKVYASSLNPFDLAIMGGFLPNLQLPMTLGGDVSGVVEGIGEGVEGLKVGEKVWGQSYAVAGDSGAWAEYSVTPSTKLSKMPENLNFDEAASLVLVGVSAIQALTEGLNLQKGEKILINGAAGGIGAAAVQIAKHIGAYVAATAKASDSDYVTTLGADEVIDYQTQDYTKLLKDYDAVFNTVRNADPNALTILIKGGRALSMVGAFDEAKASELGVTSLGIQTKVTSERLEKLRELVESGVVKPKIAKVFPLSETRQAIEALGDSSVKGKVVIDITK